MNSNLSMIIHKQLINLKFDSGETFTAFEADAKCNLVYNL